ncbi:hypothetical protein PAXINDRAFT_102930 [Paxillus involutus ATCC 200175]|uniref:DUF6534 domain-containing protein n=1 Tax=Paxillus involutus ATCC 200175 TaxID=664439 RepID=A0A0C9THR4_PAXIN|nr:hypothetical protein PAXINDRAFT_102930 [Paxillus involutus ATCC 200175]
MAPISATGTNLDTTWGSILAAVFVSLVFYGISILQMFIYYVRYPKDTFILKSLVAFVFVLNTLHTFLISAGVAQLVLGAFYTVTAMPNDTSITAISGPLLVRVANVLNGAATAVDITITIALCTLLIMGRTGFEDTDQMILRLIFISVNTGLWSAIFAFLSVILLVIYPNDLIFTALYYPLGTVYCNTLLASLNARSYARGGGNAPAAHQHTTLGWDVADSYSNSTDMGADDLTANMKRRPISEGRFALRRMSEPTYPPTPIIRFPTGLDIPLARHEGCGDAPGNSSV